MEVLKITIQNRLEAGWPVVVEHTHPEGLSRRSQDILALQKDELEEALLPLALRPQAYGQYLGKALFQGQIRAAFDRAFGSHRDHPLRVLLVVEAPELKHLRWERLCAPLHADGKWDFLSLNQSTPYSQYLPSPASHHFPAIGRRNLRALVLLANPPAGNRYQLDSFGAEATATSVHSALGEIPYDILGPVSGSVGPATLDALYARITDQHYTLLHIVAHGWYRRPDKNKGEDGETILYLLDQEGLVAPVTATRLIEGLDRLGGRRGLPHLCFLATCESARPEAEGALGGLAQRLVRELGIPAVVAMTEKVSIDTAGVLAGAFYRSLRETGLPDEALVEAVAALQQRQDVTVPALFGRLGGRPLFSDQLDGRPLTDAEIEHGPERLEGLFIDPPNVSVSASIQKYHIIRRATASPVLLDDIVTDKEDVDTLKQTLWSAVLSELDPGKQHVNLKLTVDGNQLVVSHYIEVWQVWLPSIGFQGVGAARKILDADTDRPIDLDKLFAGGYPGHYFRQQDKMTLGIEGRYGRYATEQVVVYKQDSGYSLNSEGSSETMDLTLQRRPATVLVDDFQAADRSSGVGKNIALQLQEFLRAEITKQDNLKLSPHSRTELEAIHDGITDLPPDRPFKGYQIADYNVDYIISASVTLR